MLRALSSFDAHRPARDAIACKHTHPLDLGVREHLELGRIQQVQRIEQIFVERTRRIHPFDLAIFLLQFFDLRHADTQLKSQIRMAIALIATATMLMR
jgi:hypothetical protein